jgi:hypothetical protein
MGVYGGGELPAHTAGRIVSHEPFSPIASFLLGLTAGLQGALAVLVLFFR